MKKLVIPILLFFLFQTSTILAEDTDHSTVNNVIYTAPLTVEAGQQATLSICMKNSAPIRGFQFNLKLPDGVTAVTNNKGRYVCSLNSARLDTDDEHTLTIGLQEDGSLLFLCGSQYDEVFTGNDGEVASLKLDIAKNMGAGTYPVMLNNLKLTETDISKYYETEEVECSIIVTSTVGISDLVMPVNGQASIISLSGQQLVAPKKGINIVDGKKVVIKK